MGKIFLGILIGILIGMCVGYLQHKTVLQERFTNQLRENMEQFLAVDYEYKMITRNIKLKEKEF